MRLIPTQMSIACYAGPGGPEVVIEQRRQVPQPAPGEVLIEVVAAGLNRADVLQREGHYPPPVCESDIPGLEVSGRVVDWGPGVDPDLFPGGEPVVALLGSGGYAQYVCVPAGQVLPAPKGLDLVAAGALMEVASTVVSNLSLTVPVQPGQWVLVHGGSGGIGTFALQYLRARGARPLATVSSPAKAEWALRFGAEAAINYREEDFVERVGELTGGHGADVILDVVGAKYLTRNVTALAADGRLVNIGLSGGTRAELDLGRLLAKRAGVIGTGLRSRSAADKERIVQQVHREVWPLLASGQLTVPVERRFPLSQAREAQEYFDSGAHLGKVALLAGPDQSSR